jgi:hypothetical protein
MGSAQHSLRGRPENEPLRARHAAAADHDQVGVLSPRDVQNHINRGSRDGMQPWRTVCSGRSGCDCVVQLLACLRHQIDVTMFGGCREERIFGVHHVQRRLAMPGKPCGKHESRR